MSRVIERVTALELFSTIQYECTYGIKDSEAQKAHRYLSCKNHNTEVADECSVLRLVLVIKTIVR